jgi:serine/threonine protein kinase
MEIFWKTIGTGHKGTPRSDMEHSACIGMHYYGIGLTCNLLCTILHLQLLKVTDFGLAVNGAMERPVTRLGTLDYMAPEVG